MQFVHLEHWDERHLQQITETEDEERQRIQAKAPIGDEGTQPFQQIEALCRISLHRAFRQVVKQPHCQHAKERADDEDLLIGDLQRAIQPRRGQHAHAEESGDSNDAPAGFRQFVRDCQAGKAGGRHYPDPW
ncbi:MAG: hypothetical protein BWY76_02653 [bacterium ADurb.Bin429]|nr:MAG: hypothetical protein BWY76_02653 [bacterium ADurb.Bin429]